MIVVKYFKLAWAFVCAFWILWIKFPHLSSTEKLSAIQQWSIQTLEVLNVRLDKPLHIDLVRIAEQPQLWVANHVSWVDALIIQAIQPSIFVAKAEVKRWPVVGAIATACGVIYVKRSSPSSARQMVDDAAHALRNGFHVACFPEGTSSEGLEVKPLHANMFETAIRQDIPVQPLCIRYTHAITGAHCTQAAFVGDLGFIESLHKVMSCDGIHAKVSLGQTLSPRGHSRKSLAQLAHHILSAQLMSLSA
ncbi:MAG: 1-acyl-sn-glycerol-3-phosphate acyltransferase [Pseudomonadota bacterium]|jgi:1-acyl-sn-glycerol-3-phosphate acyltransferase